MTATLMTREMLTEAAELQAVEEEVEERTEQAAFVLADKCGRWLSEVNAAREWLALGWERQVSLVAREFRARRRGVAM